MLGFLMNAPQPQHSHEISLHALLLLEHKRTFSVNVFLLVLMVIFSPIQYVPADVVINDTIDGEIIILQGTCDYGGSIGFLIPLIVIFAITSFLMMFQSYNARNLSTDLSESKFIFIILVSFDIVGLLGVPVIVLARKPVYVNIRIYVAAAMTCAM